LNFLSGANRVPIGRSRPISPLKGSTRPSCSRCFSNNHSRPDCLLAPDVARVSVWDM
jgi:hypothetical protein